MRRRCEPEPGTVLLGALQQTFIEQRNQNIQQVVEISVTMADVRSAFNRKAAHKHREPSEQFLLGSVQQTIAPVDRASKCLLPLRQIARAAGQEIEAPV